MRTIALLILFLTGVNFLNADEPIQSETALESRRFDNGREFPGATGNLELSDELFQDQPVLELSGNSMQAA